MSNPLRGEATLAVGAQSYTLVFDINALCAAQDVVKIDLDAMLEELASFRNISLLRAMLWAALLRNHPSVSLMQVGDIIGEAGMQQSFGAVLKAVAAAFPPPDGSALPNPPIGA